MTADRDEERDERISMEIIVDTYGPEEQAMGWHAYLDDTLDFPFEARCRTEREESPLKEGETVRVVGMPSTDPTLRKQFVTIEWKNRELASVALVGGTPQFRESNSPATLRWVDHAGRPTIDMLSQ